MTRYAYSVLLFAAALPCLAQQGAQQPAAKTPAPAAAAPSTAKATFVGSEICATCHEDIGKAFAKSPHAILDKGKIRRSPVPDPPGEACESCHGPGSNHVMTLSAADIRNPAKLAPAEVNTTCIACHRNQPTASGRLEASHAHNDVPCTTCHSVHGPSGLVTRVPARINTQCESCHLEVKAAFAQPFRHRVPENAMSCVDCHNPHGSFKPGLRQFANANEPGCLSCHNDKRGPFTFEHAPVREEGCQSCHMPHGSPNAKMLTRQEVRLVCLECHANLPVSTGAVTGVVPPAFHDLNSPRYRNCTICHQKIHGSHIDRNLLR